MKTVSEVINMIYENNLTVANDDVKEVPETKTVQRDFESYRDDPTDDKLVFVMQKKKGKLTKKVTAFALVNDGHVSYLEYAMLTTDTDFRELVRVLKSS